jgi:hypothetical protein
MADVFDMAAPESERTRLFELIRATPEMNWLILTKRPGQARRYLAGVAGWPWANVWLGISAGTQKSADAFIPILCEIPAYIRWISHEPILGPIDWVNSVWTRSCVRRFPRNPLDGERRRIRIAVAAAGNRLRETGARHLLLSAAFHGS